MIYVDFDSVLFAGNQPIPGALEFMDNLTQKDEVIVFANSPARAIELLDKYAFRYSSVIAGMDGFIISEKAIPCQAPDEYDYVLDVLG